MKSKIPEIRFGEFTQEWEELKLGDIAEFFNGKRVPIESESRIKGQYPYYGATGIIDYVEGYIFEGEYVLLAEDGANIIMRNSAIAYLTEGKFWVNNHAHIMKMKSGSNVFLTQVLENQNYEKYNSGTAQPKLNSQVVKNIILNVPHKKEQTKIGDLFKQLDTYIAFQEQELTTLKQTKQGFLLKMFPKEGESVPELRFPGFTVDWEERMLGDILKINSGRDYKHLQKGNIPVYGTGGYMLSVNDKLSDENAIGIGRKGTINKPQLLKAPFWTVDTLFFMTTKEKNDLYFCYTLANKIHWKKYDESTGVPSLSKASIEKIPAIIPTFEEQTKIGNFFKQLDDTIALHQRELDALKETKKAFLQKMFV